MDKAPVPHQFHTNQPIRVLHIFAPGIRRRFTGPVVQWKYYFSRWDDPRVVHSVVDTQAGKLADSREVFNFQLAETQRKASRRERFTWILALFRTLVRRRSEFDLVHVHVLWWGGLLTGPWGRWSRCPTVYESVLLGADTPGGILQEKFGKLKLRCLQSFTGILAISETLAEDYLQHGFTPERVHLQMNSVDTDLFKPPSSAEQKTLLREKYGLPRHSKILLFVGSIIERKGVDTLVHAFIEAAGMNPDLHLVITGAKNKNENPSLDEDFVNRLMQLIYQNGMEMRVKFTGLLQDREQLADIYRAADIFLFPSRNEGLPTVVLEAMSAGLPVVTAQLPVLEKVISHGENGLFVPPGDAAALSAAVLRLCKDAPLAERLSCGARASIVTHHTFPAWQAEKVALYQTLINRTAVR